MLLIIIGYHILGLEDKVAACEMLVCYARELKDAFADYAEEVVRLMIPLLKFYFHDGVRTAAAQSLPHLLECVRIKGTYRIIKILIILIILMYSFSLFINENFIIYIFRTRLR